MKTNTSFFLFNESGLIPAEKLPEFCRDIHDKSMFDFVQYLKNDIDELTTIYSRFITNNLEFTIFDYGYVMKVEGCIPKSVLFLYELDKIITNTSVFYLSPTQRLENNDEYLYPRGSKLNKLASFLDKLFNSNAYSDSISNF